MTVRIRESGKVAAMQGNRETVQYAKVKNRSTRRGSAKIYIQWKLNALVHNLEKIGRYGGMNN